MNSQTARTNMLKQQLRAGNVLNETILQLFEEIPRDQFVPDALQAFAYSDSHLPLPHQQFMMTPLEEGLLLQSLELQGHEVVLEVGTGTGFLTTLLSRRAKKVISIDLFADFTTAAQKKLTQFECSNVELLTGDGSHGFPSLAPYDIIVFSGTLESLLEIHQLQLLPGGKLFALIGTSPVSRGELHHLSHSQIWQKSLIFETNLPPLIDKTKMKEFVF